MPLFGHWVLVAAKERLFREFGTLGRCQAREYFLSRLVLFRTVLEEFVNVVDHLRFMLLGKLCLQFIELDMDGSEQLCKVVRNHAPLVQPIHCLLGRDLQLLNLASVYHKTLV